MSAMPSVLSINLTLGPADKVLPCPFCGCEKPELENTWTACYWLECPECLVPVEGESFSAGGGDHKLSCHRQAKASAIEAWNRRAS